MRKGTLEPYWGRNGHSGWILTQEICKAMLRSMGDKFKMPREDMLVTRIKYKDLSVDGDSTHVTAGPSIVSKKSRLLVALHAGYLTVKEVSVKQNIVHLAIPNKEISTTVLGLLNQNNARWKRVLDEGFANDDVRVMMKGMSGEDGFLHFWRETSVIDSGFMHETVADISEAWLEKMVSFMFLTGSVPTATQDTVPKEVTTVGRHPSLDVLFRGVAIAHVIELNNKKTSLEDALEQLEKYAHSKRLKNVLYDWKKPPLFWVVYFDKSHLGNKEDVADVTRKKIRVEGPYETDEDGKLQLRIVKLQQGG